MNCGLFIVICRLNIKITYPLCRNEFLRDLRIRDGEETRKMDPDIIFGVNYFQVLK